MRLRDGDCPAHPDLALAPDGSRLYGLYPYTVERTDEGVFVRKVEADLLLQVWETETGELVREVRFSDQVSVPNATGGRGDAGYLAVSPDGQRLYVAWEDHLWALAAESLQVAGELRLPAIVDGMALSVDGRELYLLPSAFGDPPMPERGLLTVDTASLTVARRAPDWPNLTNAILFAAPAPAEQ